MFKKKPPGFSALAVLGDDGRVRLADSLRQPAREEGEPEKAGGPVRHGPGFKHTTEELVHTRLALAGQDCQDNARVIGSPCGALCWQAVC
jgi:hypothetical protein